jgi:hypothetical protein
MKRSEPWHGSFLGRSARFLGSVKLAVPVMVLVACAMAWGTYLESTQSSKVSRAVVYGSWWFIALMGLVCLSLIFAVVVRFPWQRKHVGFITVHAGLVALIVGGFWSLFGRVEGHLALEEGTSGDVIELDHDVIELCEVNAGVFKTLATVDAPMGPARLTLAGIEVGVAERWDNTTQELFVADGAPEALRAVEISLTPGASTGSWIGDESKTGMPGSIGGMRVRILRDGASWEPPAKSAAAEGPAFSFFLGERQFPLAGEGKEALPGWTVESVKNFKHAMVSAGGLTEGDAGSDNPAVEVVIGDGKGTRERHSAFSKFPDMAMSRTLEGTARSGARLGAPPGAAADGTETLVIYGPASAPQVGYIAADGTAAAVPVQGPLPWRFKAGSRDVSILRQFTHAFNDRRFREAPPAKEHRAALVLKAGGGDSTIVLPWKDIVPIPATGRNLVLKFGPASYPLPFTVRLDDFRKVDYPGTEMAMAYESDVTVTSKDGTSQPFRIFMNNPYSKAPWKVYQSGFMGENLSVFSVMKDPGLPLTYAGSILLCVGILITFYSRSLSWGHPGIPVGFSHKEPQNVPRVPDPLPVAAREPAGAGV